MRLRGGNKVIENDGIVTIVYEIVEVKGKVALGATQFEGQTYYTTYQRKYLDPKEIRPVRHNPLDFTRRELAIQTHEHTRKSK